MYQSQITQKQKDSLSNFHYVFKRTLSHVGPTATARKRRLFIAGIIALSGVIIHHVSAQGSRAGAHASSQAAHLLTENLPGSREYIDANIFLGGFGALLLLFFRTGRINTFSKDYGNFIYTTAQDIRGSPA